MSQPAITQNTVEPADPELEELRAKREALAARRLARAAAEAPALKRAAEALALAGEVAIDEAETSIGPLGKKIAAVQTDLGVIVVKRPHPALFKRFQDRGKTNSKELDELVRPCLVYPTLTEYEKICDELPATALRVADAVSGLAGVRAEDLAGKS